MKMIILLNSLKKELEIKENYERKSQSFMLKIIFQ